MSQERFEPRVHRPPTLDEVEAIGNDLHFNLDTDEVKSMKELLDHALGGLKEIDELPDFIPEVKYPRTPGYKPQPEDNVGNAWAWRCRIEGSPTGKLAGKTVAIKDNTAVAGVPMSNGSRVLEGYVPEYDATTITRILDAGGRIEGKASCDDFCFSAMGFSSVDGYIHLPKRPNLRVGGSSGGSAVLVAAGAVDLALGGDQGGSIRIPSAWTGCVGLKPTWGLVPYTGIAIIEPTVDHAGPIARNVSDCALFLEVLAGPDGMDPRQPVRFDVPEYSKLLEVDVSGKKLGVLKEGMLACEESTQVTISNFLGGVSKANLSTVDVSVPLHSKSLALLTGFIFQGLASCLKDTGGTGQWSKGFYSTSYQKAISQGMASSAQMASPGVKHFTMAGEMIRRRYGNHYYCKTQNLITKMSNQYDEVLSTCDVIVMPTLTHTTEELPKKLGDNVETETEYLKKSIDMIANTCVANMTGHPALTLPLGPVGEGRTASLMIVGRKFDELTVLQIARALEKMIPSRN